MAKGAPLLINDGRCRLRRLFPSADTSFTDLSGTFIVLLVTTVYQSTPEVDRLSTTE